MDGTTVPWTDFTFNPWSGCTKVSPGCKNCYAEVNYSVKMRGVKWGPQGNRIVKAESGWKEPLKWDRAAQCNCGAAGNGPGECQWCASGCKRPRVFCASLADVFEDWQGPMLDSKGERLVIYKPNGGFLTVAPYAEEPGPHCRWMTMQDVRARLFRLIDATPNLDWQLLTKRPENILRMAHDAWTVKVKGHVSQNEGDGRHWKFPPNVWVGTSVENQEAADERIPILLKIPAAVRFLSCEPLLGPITLHPFVDPATGQFSNAQGINCDWVIVGGESGHGARPCDPQWIRSIVKQCQSAGVGVFVKQMGGNIVTRNDMIEDSFNNQGDGWPDPNVEHNIHGYREGFQGADCRLRLRDKKGGNPQEWPEDLRVREFPKVDRAPAPG